MGAGGKTKDRETPAASIVFEETAVIFVEAETIEAVVLWSVQDEKGRKRWRRRRRPTTRQGEVCGSLRNEK